MKTKYYLIIGAFALSLFLIINIPASLVVNAVKDQAPQINIQNVSGTLWQGSAQRVTVQSKYVFKNVEWSVCAAHLLIAEACIELNAMYNKNPLSGQVSVGINKTLHGKNIKTAMSAQSLGQMITLPIGEIAGNISLDLATLSYEQGGIPAVNGVIQWNNASITIAEMAKLGNITITLTDSDESSISAEISNQDGQLAIAGRASVSANTDYNVDLNLTPNNTASNNLKSSLSLFARPQPDGSFIVKNNGNLKQLGLM